MQNTDNRSGSHGRVGGNGSELGGAPAPGRSRLALRRTARALSLLLGSAALASSCGPLDDLWPPDVQGDKPSHDPRPSPHRKGPDDSIFARDRVLQVDIELDPADWEVLRFEGKSIAEFFGLALEDLAPFEYSSFPAQIRIDGRAYPDVALSKFAFIGNLSSLRPQLAIDFAPEGRLRSGVRKMMLKNGLEDPSLTRECLALEIFAAAGYPAPRCNYAHVSVNGRDLGLYVHAEGIDEHMLARHFEDGSGNLYHGEGVDLFDNTLPFIRSENTPPRSDRRDLDALLRALDANDADLVDELGAVLDLDAFRDFWALETLLGHWDGYTNSLNNYYLYADPQTGLFHFLPWDLDQAFVGAVPFRPPYEITVYYAGRVASRLYQNREQRALYRQRLGELNDTLWDAETLLARTAELAALVAADPQTLEAHQQYLREHAEALREALREPAPEVPPATPFAPVSGDECQSLLTSVSGSFETIVSENVYRSDAVRGIAQLETSPDGQPLASSDAFSFAGRDEVVPGTLAVYVASELPDGAWLGFPLVMPEGYFQPGVYPLHGFDTFIPATVMRPFDITTIASYGYVVDGEIRLDEAATELGAPVSGSFSGSLLQLGCRPQAAAP